MAKYYGAAAEYNKPSGFSFNNRVVFIILLVVVALIFVSVGLALFNAARQAPGIELATLVLREQKLQQFIAGEQKNIKSGKLSQINSNANLLLTSDTVALNKQLRATYGAVELPEETVRGEVDRTSEKLLKDAQLIDKYDDRYASILREKIAASQQLAKKILENASGALKNALTQNAENLRTIDTQLDAL